MSDPNIPAVAQALRNQPLADPGALLIPRGRARIRETLAQWRAQGRNAYVVTIARGAELAPWRQLWTALDLDPQDDLLLLFNGNRWEARGWGLPPARLSALLDSAEPELKHNYGRGLIAAVHTLGNAASGRPQPRPGDRSTPSGGRGLWLGAGAAAVFAGGAAMWVIRRRARRTASRERRFRDAVAAAEKAYADVVLTAEGLQISASQSQIAELQLHATKLKQQLDAITAEVGTRTSAMADPVTLSKICQLENELATIRSTIRQLARKAS